jgi:Mg2+-importing ATPase
VKFIEKFMVVFGPISSLYDFLTYGVMLFVFYATPALFQTGWFVESMATEVLIVFAIRTVRSPFYKSRPSKFLALGCLAVVAAAVLIPFTPLGALFGFVPLPAVYFAVLMGMVVTYLAIVEVVKKLFYAKYQL